MNTSDYRKLVHGSGWDSSLPRPRKPLTRTPFGEKRRGGLQTEAKFQRQVEATAEALGWYAWHVRNAKQSKAGFPDLMLVRERVVWMELKVYYESGRANKVMPEQERFHDMLRAAGQEVYVVYDDDDGWATIKEVLKP